MLNIWVSGVLLIDGFTISLSFELIAPAGGLFIEAGFRPVIVKRVGGDKSPIRSRKGILFFGEGITSF